MRRYQPNFYDRIMIPLLVASATVFVIFVFKSNPLLMSNTTMLEQKKEKKQKVFTVPTELQDDAISKLSNLEEDEKTRPSSKKLFRAQIYPLNKDYLIENSIQFYKDSVLGLSSQNRLVRLSVPSLESIWSFEVIEKNQLFKQFLIHKNTVFASTTEGEIYAINLENGTLRWHTKTNYTFSTPLALHNNNLHFLAKNLESTKNFLAAYDMNTGAKKWHTKTITGEPFEKLTLAPARDAIIVSMTDGNIFFFNAKDGAIIWKKQLPELPHQAVTSFDQLLITVSQSATLYGINLRNGSVRWSHRLKGVPHGPFYRLPQSTLIGVLTNSRHFQVIDLKDGEGQWHHKINDTSQMSKPFSIKLNAKVITEDELKWKRKGWVFAASCSKTRICLFDPDKGRMISRIDLKGEPLSPPLLDLKDRKFYVMTKNLTDLKNFLEPEQKVDEKPKQALALIMDFPYYKRIKQRRKPLTATKNEGSSPKE